MESMDFFDEVTLISKGQSQRMTLFDAVREVTNSPDFSVASAALIVQEGRPVLRFSEIVDLAKREDFPPLAAD